MNTCPCCSTQLLRHARQNRVYWFCSHCWQEMPDLAEMVIGRNKRAQKLEGLTKLSTWNNRLRTLDEVGIA
ncbi:MAG: hypothetical protein ACM37W_16080 [Actinomycetota bacterium]